MTPSKTIGRFGVVIVLLTFGCSLLSTLMGCDFSVNPLPTAGTTEKWNIVQHPAPNLSGQWKGTGYTSISPLVTLSLDISHNQDTVGYSGTYRFSRNSITSNGKLEGRVVGGYFIDFYMHLMNPDSTSCFSDFRLTRLGKISADTMDVRLTGTDCLGYHEDGRVLLVKI